MHTVYLIENQTNGKYYVGQTGGTLPYRLRQHFYDSRSVVRPLRMPLHRAMRETPRENWTISPVAECKTVEEAHNREKLFILVLKATNPELGYNVSPGGNGPLGSGSHAISPETRRRMSRSAKARCARNMATHCPHGHPYSEENTIVRAGRKGLSARVCRTCVLEHERKRRLKRYPHAGIGRGGVNRQKTRCKRGHEFTLDNVIPLPNGGRKCRACEQHRSKHPGVGTGGAHRLITHCPHGHKYTPETTILSAEGWRRCRICANARTAKQPGIGKGGTKRIRTHCPNDHPLSGDNLIVRPSEQHRRCRACTKERDRVRKRTHYSTSGGMN